MIRTDHGRRTSALQTIVTAAAVWAVTLAAGCGATTELDVCHANCDTSQRCGLKNATETTNCHNDCTNNAGFHQQADIALGNMCTNPGDVRGAQIACNGNTDACNLIALAACQATALGKCIKK